MTPAAAASRRPVLDPAGQHHAGQAASRAPSGHPGDHLAAQRLVVERALAGDHQVGRVERGVQPDQPRGPGRCRTRTGRRGEQRGAEPAGRAGAGQRRQPGRAARQVALQHAGEALQRGVQQQHVLPGGALLRAVHVAARRAGRSAGCPRRSRRPGATPRSRGTPPSPAHGDQRGAAVRQGVPGRVQRGGAERGQHPGAAVVGRRAAQARPRPRVAPGLDRGGEQQRPARTTWCASGRARPRSSRCRPQAWALSTYAVAPTSSTSPATGRPSGSTVGTGDAGAPPSAAASTSTKPGRRRPAAASTSSSRRGRRPPARRRPRRPPRGATACRRTCPDRSSTRIERTSLARSQSHERRSTARRARRGDHRMRDVDLDRTRRDTATALLLLGRGSDPRSERGVDCPGDLPAPSDPDLVARAAGGQGRARRPRSSCSATTTSATRSSSSPTSPATRSSSPARPRPAGRGVHRLLRRALHGRERRHPHLAPTQQVVLPDLAAGCSMADMAALGQVETAWDALDRRSASPTRRVPVTYMNSSADIKGFVGRNGGVVCTSSNAKRALDWAFERGPAGVLPARPAPRPQHRGAASWASRSTTACSTTRTSRTAASPPSSCATPR